ncbi:MAG TPA: RDD family protein [Acidimicrobiales bacterium]|nr:RDD family protein [Acidimicrobiales bacterium]
MLAPVWSEPRPPCQTAPLATSTSPLVGVGRRALARSIDAVIAAGLTVAAFALTPDDRPVLGFVVAILLVTAQEASLLASVGATPGKLATGLRVRALDHAGPLPVAAALRRSVIVAVVGLSVVGLPALVASASLSPMRRGFHDRRSGTVVLPRAFGSLIAHDYVRQWEAAGERTPVTPLGPVASLAERRRARAHRLDHAPLLVAGTVALTASGELGDGIGPLVVISLAWLTAFVADETWRVSRYGQTGGHWRERVMVVDRRSGEPPGPWRSFLRALVLAPLFYVPPLQLILAAWVRLSNHNLGPHDLAGRTVVIRLPQWQPAS